MAPQVAEVEGNLDVSDDGFGRLRERPNVIKEVQGGVEPAREDTCRRLSPVTLGPNVKVVGKEPRNNSDHFGPTDPRP
eukprot:9421229-Alexandrium_andersonii.AAC.1